MCGGEGDTVLIPDTVVALVVPTSFDCLQYANTEGEGLGDLVTCGGHTGGGGGSCLFTASHFGKCIYFPSLLPHLLPSCPPPRGM